MSEVVLGVWTPFRQAGPLGPPEDLPLGRAALALAEEHIELVIGQPISRSCFDGVVARPGRWKRARHVQVQGVYDRFPSASQPEAFEAGLKHLRAVPVANPPLITELCRDKLRCQRALMGIPQPDVVGSGFENQLRIWGTAFLKPRYGSFGVGVRRVSVGDPLPDVEKGWVLQRAVPPPEGFGAGLALRILVQKVGLSWVIRDPVARMSAEDAVVNAGRGADIVPAEDRLDAQTLRTVSGLARQVARRLSLQARPLVELGVDIVLNPERRPFVIEVNSRPRGRLRSLAEQWPDRFAAAHTEACVAPFRYLASVLPSKD